jgi:hypothetical protein
VTDGFPQESSRTLKKQRDAVQLVFRSATGHPANPWWNLLGETENARPLSLTQEIPLEGAHSCAFSLLALTSLRNSSRGKNEDEQLRDRKSTHDPPLGKRNLAEEGER